jgi:hypothetical protein
MLCCADGSDCWDCVVSALIHWPVCRDCRSSLPTQRLPIYVLLSQLLMSLGTSVRCYCSSLSRPPCSPLLVYASWGLKRELHPLRYDDDVPRLHCDPSLDPSIRGRPLSWIDLEDRAKKDPETPSVVYRALRAEMIGRGDVLLVLRAGIGTPRN